MSMITLHQKSFNTIHSCQSESFIIRVRVPGSLTRWLAASLVHYEIYTMLKACRIEPAVDATGETDINESIKSFYLYILYYLGYLECTLGLNNRVQSGCHHG